MSEALEKAKKRLIEGEYTCVIDEFFSKERGIKPIMDWLRAGAIGSVCADRVIGKAAAMLLVYGGVKELYAEIISEHALEFLETADVLVSFGEKTKYIINRKGDGMCPMEERALNLSDPVEAFKVFSSLRA